MVRPLVTFLKESGSLEHMSLGGWCPQWVVGVCARRWRRSGRYDKKTLAAFGTVWRRTGSAAALLRYALFRRDLGWKLPKRWVAPLLYAAGNLRTGERSAALALVAETESGALGGVPKAWLQEAADRFPALAAYTESPLGRARCPFAQLTASQDEWRREFGEWLARRRGEGIVVVGNAAVLCGHGFGERIDRAGAVIRFNLFRSPETRDFDIGKRTDVWSVSPGYRGLPIPDVGWGIVTGPDMRFGLQDWSAVVPLLDAGRPVLTVPLSVWKGAVQRLQAPPSAGILTLAWIRELLASWEGVTSVGIGAGLSRDGRYHLADHRQRAVSRHRWEAERQLVAQWEEEGLTVLLSGKTRSFGYQCSGH